MTQDNLDHFAFNDKPLEEFFKTKKKKEIESVYQDEISTNSNKNPVRFGKPKFKSKKERNGKVKKLTPEEYYNQDPNGNFGKCNRIKDVVISLLLSGLCATSRELYATIESRSTHNIELKNRIATEHFSIDKIYTIMWELKKSNFSKYILLIPTASKKTFAYELNKDAKSFTLEKAVKLSKQYKKGLRKSVIKKAVKKAKKQRESFDENQLEFLNKMLSQIVLKEDFEKYAEHINEEIEGLKELVNQLMINTPASDLKKSFNINSNKLEVEVKGGIEVSFRIAGLG